MDATMISHTPVLTFLTLPAELRNAIYAYVFCSTANILSSTVNEEPSPQGLALKLDQSRFHRAVSLTSNVTSPPQYLHLRPLLTCRQIYQEAHLYAISHTTYHLSSKACLPDLFDLRSRSLNTSAKLAALKHLTLSGKISSLRALNESWNGLPFGHPSLRLETLVLVPQRPNVAKSVWGEIADLSQAHTLAYVFGETFKGLKNVRMITVVNRDCFKSGVFDLVYRTLVYRLYRWGGCACGVRFERPEVFESGCENDASFNVYFGELEDRGREVGEEVCRLLGRDGTDPVDTDLALDAGVGP